MGRTFGCRNRPQVSSGWHVQQRNFPESPAYCNGPTVGRNPETIATKSGFCGVKEVQVEKITPYTS